MAYSEHFYSEHGEGVAVPTYNVCVFGGLKQNRVNDKKKYQKLFNFNFRALK